ncbi:MAG: hypothetical protein M1819_003961 [Sarea resinae]|nr:MAG: hypothetical protein M1819_003961 [Sarea resinae]
MSEVQTRPSAPRGRGSARGGRGGHGTRGGARGGGRYANGEKSQTTPIETLEDEGEIGQLKKQYAGQLSTIKEMFPDWTDEDIIFALEETNGDLESTIDRITEGNVSQWGEVKKKSKGDRSRSKVKESISTIADTAAAPMRGARGKTSRGRGSERGRGVGRGGRAGSNAPTNGARPSATTKTSAETTDVPTTSIPTNESPAWDKPAPVPETTENSVDQPSAGVEQKSSVIPTGVKKSWASMFAKPAPPPVTPKASAAPQSQEKITETPAAPKPSENQAAEPEVLPPSIETTPAEEKSTGEVTPITPSESASQLTPPRDELTETNLEQVLDESNPPATATVASTVATSRDPRSTAASVTPLTASHPPSGSRPALGGFATSAHKATGTPGRASSFQRRILEQQEAVVMPGNHAVDRAAVQFGSLGLNGSADDLDVDEEREEAETRAQPPQHSPVAHPVASLPPAPRQSSIPSEQPIQDAAPTPRQAPGLPPVPQPQNQMPQQQSPQAPVGPQAMAHQGSQGSQQYGQFNRYGQQQEQAAPSQKPYDPFGQQTQIPTQQYEGYPGQSQAPQQPQSQTGGFSSAPNDYSSYYTSDQQRNAYQNYYGSTYGQQAPQNQQDAGFNQQRSTSGFGAAADTSSQYPSQAQQSQPRYGEQTSGHTTPNPSLPGQQIHAGQSQQGQHLQQQPHNQAGAHGAGYPYGHPYFSSPYYAAYLNQESQFGYGGQGYAAPFGKGGMYGQPHHGYGMSPQSSFEHSASPANPAGFGQPGMQGRDSGLGGGLGDYGRSGSAQASNQQPSAASAFGGMPDVFGRSGAGFPGQNQGLGQQPSDRQTGGEESLKPFGEPKAASGPSPSLNQPGRPTSATNHTPAQASQSGLPPPQSQQSQQGFGGYPSHLHAGQYGGLGGLGGHQAAGQGHQTSGYGSYGAGFGNYYGNSGRGGWGGNYGH